ncbi:uncharacterized protein LOC120674736 [Panicum virgatum]|uniref:uncharacterized protein LOC120674736 n=1 Tax=Panicum virgatum TaxID=38727 RepID=UPI0019D5D046|nr:uncharacterized protein LOC120674736 [Panicum virgatum]
MAPGGVKPRPKKTVVANQQTTRTKRPKRSLAASDIPVPTPTPSVSRARQDEENVGNFDDHLQPFVQDDSFDQLNSNISVANGSDGIDNQQCNGTSLPNGHNLVAIEVDHSAQPDANDTEVRNDIPILKNWKEYKKQPGLLRMLMGRLKIKFDIDINAAPVKKACYEMMKSAIHQQCYKLKKKYFNPYPLHLVTKTSPVKSITDTQWNDLVEFWKTPQKIEACETNKTNRGNVKYHQTTSSRSYEVHLENLGDKYKDQELDALDLFKECHYSNKKNGYTVVVQSAITQMETRIAEPAEEQEIRSVTEVVAGVLAQNTKKNTFLENVGIHNNQPTSGGQNLQAELLAQRENAELRLLVNSQREQMHELSTKLQETEQARTRDREEMAKKQVETDAKLELVLSMLQRH